jgi:hypothetical protein
VDDNEGERCPGEIKCHHLKKPGMEDPVTTCPDCPLYLTKQSREPEYITILLSTAMQFDEMKEAGLVIGDINALSPIQWAAVKGLQRGRRLADEYKDTKDKQQR